MEPRLTMTPAGDARLSRADGARGRRVAPQRRAGGPALIAVAALALASGCQSSGDARSERTLAPSALLEGAGSGSLSIPLVTSGAGLHRLRQASFEVERAGVLVLRLDSESAPGAEAIGAELDPGQYQIRLRDGWSLERLDAAGGATAVRGALISANPAAFSVRDGRITTVAFTFTTSSGVVAFGAGAVSVRLGVADPASLATCDVVNQAGCDEGQHCLLADAEGSTFCATPGQLPLGAPCSSEQCVVGAQCLSLDLSVPDRGACTALCDPQAPAFGCDCRGLDLGSDVGVCGPPPPGTCDLLDPASCPEGQACQYPGGSFGVCGAPGTVGEGGSCFGEECEAGLDCFGDDAELGSSGICYRFCDVLAPGCEFCFTVDTGNVGRCFL